MEGERASERGTRGEVTVRDRRAPTKELQAVFCCWCYSWLAAQSCLTLCNSTDCSPPAPLSMGFSRQEYWSGLPMPSPGDLPDLGIEPASPALAGGFFTSEPPGKPRPADVCMCSVVPDSFRPHGPPGSSVQGIFHQEYWSGMPFPTPGDLPNPGMESTSPPLMGGFLIIAPPRKPWVSCWYLEIKGQK